MPEKILVTGGAGYLGSTMIPILLKKGFRVTAVDNLIFNQTSLLDCCANKNFEFVQGDICNYNLLNKLISKSDTSLFIAFLIQIYEIISTGVYPIANK